MRVVQEEIFGPVIVALAFDDDDEGIAIANGTDFALYDYVFSSDTNRAFRASRRMRAGNIGINTTQRNHHAPFGGNKLSGVGRDGGVFGLHAYSELQSRRVARLTPLVGKARRMTASIVSIVPDGVLAYGMQLPVQALSTRVAMPWNASAAPSTTWCGSLRPATTQGFSMSRAAITSRFRAGQPRRCRPPWFDPVATLAFLAARTRRTRLMTNVYVAAYRHPLETAKAFATVDALSGGRVLFGVGAGHVEGEFAALGVPFAERGAITDESIDAILAAWTDEWAPHDGPRWRYADVGQGPRPVQQPHPPIWIGGSGKPALRRVARVGDGWIPQATPPDRLADDIAYILHERDRVRPGVVPEVRLPRLRVRRRSGLGTPQVHDDRDRPNHRCAQRGSAPSASRTYRYGSRRARPTNSANRSRGSARRSARISDVSP